MKTFRYHRLKNEPCLDYEGDRMKKEGDFIEITRQPRRGENGVIRVAIFHLAEGEFVDELGEPDNRRVGGWPRSQDSSKSN